MREAEIRHIARFSILLSRTASLPPSRRWTAIAAHFYGAEVPAGFYYRRIKHLFPREWKVRHAHYTL